MMGMLSLARSAAIAEPCLLPQETVRPRFAWQLGFGYSLVLTLNTGFE